MSARTSIGPLLIGAGLILGLTSPIKAATGTIQDVKHVVIFMQENRSFDHYFGTMKGVRGFGDPAALRQTNGQSILRQSNGAGHVLPFPLKTPCVTDTDHGWDSGHSAWNSGRWNQWIPAKGSATMTYYSRAQLPFHFALAESYTICDAYFCSVMGPTNPNRLYLWSGMVDPQGTGGGPVIDNREPYPGFTWKTYPERLQEAGVSWRVYQEYDNYDDNALAWFARYQLAAPDDVLVERGLTFTPDMRQAFADDVRAGTLPKVSWLIAPTVLSEHPPWSPGSGGDYTKDLLDALALNPEVLNSTVFILNYDENDGFFDHVVPPVAPARTAGEFVGGQPIGLGVRVPCILVSPWSRGGYVSSQVFDHTSILRFLETWTGVKEPNISAWRRKICGDLTSAFDFAHPDFSQPNIPRPDPTFCDDGALPPVPAIQVYPQQEAGARPRRPVPYQPDGAASVDCTKNELSIRVSNSGSAAIHIAIHANAYRTTVPAQLDVEAGGSLSTRYDLTPSKGDYDFTIYGPDGFLRQFAGGPSSNCKGWEATSSVDAERPELKLTFANTSDGLASYIVTAEAPQAGGPWTVDVPPGSTAVQGYPVNPAEGGNYNLQVTLKNDPSFLRRFAGHIEAESVLRLGFALSSGTLVLNWNGSPGLSLQQSSDLGANNWVTVPGTLGASSASVTVQAGGQFFRLAK